MINIEDLKEEYAKLSESLHQQRDELKVKVHLANMEVREEWDELENKFEHMKSKAKQAKEVAGESAGEINEAALLLGEEIKKSYQRLKELL